MKGKRLFVLAGGLVLVAVVVAVVALVAFRPRGEIKRCRLLFGPTGGTEVILEIDGDRLFVRPGLGAQASPQELGLSNDRLAEDVTITVVPAPDAGDATQTTRYTITSVHRYQDTEPTPRDSLIVHVKVEDRDIRYEQYCDVDLRGRSEPLVFAHFHGPLTVLLPGKDWKPPESLRLVKREEPQEIRVVVGTIDMDRGCWTVVRTHRGEESCFPDGVFPYAEIEFPPESPSGQAIVERFPLEEFC
jgi:hypothetical protein